MSFSNQGTRDTELTVIVYKYWGIDETIRKIETEHNKIRNKHIQNRIRGEFRGQSKTMFCIQYENH